MMEQQLVVFELANECYGINIATVESIIKIQTITQLPHTRGYIRGVTNLRGSVLPVIDLRARFSLERKDDARETRIIVVSMENIKVGVVVDSVSEVLRVSDESFEPPAPILSTVDPGFIKGIAKVGTKSASTPQAERLIILLDLSEMLSIKQETVPAMFSTS